MADVRTALGRGRARGGAVEAIVDRRLGSIETVVTGIEEERRALDLELTTKRAARDAANERARATVNACHDTLWNDVGRPGNDPLLGIVFPGGASYYVEGAMEDRADRLGILIDLLERRIHPRIAEESVATWVARLTADRDACRAASDDLRGPAARAEQAERAYFALVRSAHAGLVNAKRDLKSEGITEAEIHEVIPSRPRIREEEDATPPGPNGPSAPPTS